MRGEGGGEGLTREVLRWFLGPPSSCSEATLSFFMAGVSPVPTGYR
jgi:hypothetical protein